MELKAIIRKNALLAVLMLLSLSWSILAESQTKVLQFIYTSDSHFGITRTVFQGDSNVSSIIVNEAMVKKMNALPSMKLPVDGGINAGQLVGSIDYLINTGDIANREEPGIQNATASWEQFNTTYLEGITLKNSKGKKTGIFLLPGNHDVSNAIGHYKIKASHTDNASMVGIYNFTFLSNPKTSATYNYETDKIHYSKDISGLHFLFVNIWPDSSERIWMEKDLKSVTNTTPVIIFTHDEPDVESKHFTNPNGTHSINGSDKFENLLPEVFKDGATTSIPSNIEQRGFVRFFKEHKNIKAYFHGNEHVNDYYIYKGPDNDIELQTIQVDSPMKGKFSSKDETKLSFQLVTIDLQSKKMTVRECLWNTVPSKSSSVIVWGKEITLSLK